MVSTRLTKRSSPETDTDTIRPFKRLHTSPADMVSDGETSTEFEFSTNNTNSNTNTIISNSQITNLDMNFDNINLNMESIDGSVHTDSTENTSDIINLNSSGTIAIKSEPYMNVKLEGSNPNVPIILDFDSLETAPHMQELRDISLRKQQRSRYVRRSSLSKTEAADRRRKQNRESARRTREKTRAYIKVLENNYERVAEMNHTLLKQIIIMKAHAEGHSLSLDEVMLPDAPLVPAPTLANLPPAVVDMTPSPPAQSKPLKNNDVPKKKRGRRTKKQMESDAAQVDNARMESDSLRLENENLRAELNQINQQNIFLSSQMNFMALPPVPQMGFMNAFPDQFMLVNDDAYLQSMNESVMSPLFPPPV